MILSDFVFLSLLLSMFHFEGHNFLSDERLDYYSKDGKRGEIINTMNDFKKISNGVSEVKIKGYYTPGDGGGGIYLYDEKDKISRDNGGTILVTNDGKRFKLVGWDGDIRKFGARIDDVTDDSKAVQTAIDTDGWAVIPKVGGHKAMLASSIKITKQGKITGEGTITTRSGKQNIFLLSPDASIEMDGINISLPAGYDGDVIRSSSSLIYQKAPITITNIKGVTLGKGKLITVMERRTNITIAGCSWQGGTGMCLLRAAKGAKISHNTITASARGIVFFGGSDNIITGNTVNGQNVSRTGISFFSNRSAAGADNLEKGNLIDKNNIHDVTEEGISFDCIGNDSSRSPENPAAPIVSVDKILGIKNAEINIGILNMPNVGDKWADNYYGIFLTGNCRGLFLPIGSSHSNSIAMISTGDDGTYDIKPGDKILITTGSIQNIIVGNTINNAGTHAIALYGSCWGNQVLQNTINNAKWRGISVVSVLGGGDNEHAYSGMNIIAKNTITMKYDPNNKKVPKIQGASICIESREYSKDANFVVPRTFGNLVYGNKVNDMPIRVIKSWETNILQNEITSDASGIELINAFATNSFKNVTTPGLVIKPVNKQDSEAKEENKNGFIGSGSKDFSDYNADKKFTVTYTNIRPSSSQTQYIPVADGTFSNNNFSVIPITQLPDGCIYSLFVSSKNKIGVRIFNLSLANSVAPGTLTFSVK